MKRQTLVIPNEKALVTKHNPAAFLTRAAYARHHNLGHPDSLAAELAEIEANH